MPKVLVANRGEIAVRILRAATELGWGTVAIYTDNDPSHAAFATEAVKLKSVAEYMDVNEIVRVTVQTKCTHVHPGYGFLSENPELPLALAKATANNVVFIGPSPDVLRIASDKMLSRDLAGSLDVSIAPGVRVASAADVKSFAGTHGYPVIIKALDGGGGRGIRVVEVETAVDEAFKRCLGESPSRQVFAEKALVGAGWKHIEVQIIGDGTGVVNHQWERECSVQRRFQKIVEASIIAPSPLPRDAIKPLLDASLKMAGHLKYHGLGTFEYLFNTQTRNWVFLEINPRVQVINASTEEIVDNDLVRAQILLFTPSTTLASLGLASPPQPPAAHAVQLRLTAEDPARNFQLSPGTIQAADVNWPSGRGVRVDTWLVSGPFSKAESWTVGTEFDSLLAKIIVRGRTFEEMADKARRALKEIQIGGVKTNIAVLTGVLDHRDWQQGRVDTLWLERNLEPILEAGSKTIISTTTPDVVTQVVATSGAANVLLQPGTTFNLVVQPSTDVAQALKHTLTIDSIGHNAFPNKLTGTMRTSLLPGKLPFELTQSASTGLAGDSDSEFADLNDSRHIAAPMTGKVVEAHPAFKDKKIRVRKGEPLVILSVMKMENSIVAPRDGFVSRVGKGVKVGRVLGEGMLICVIEEQEGVVSRL
ncbi:hypothetical protein CVT24_007086 [Panaeolus cyanescens]|uniref:Uncharacterized protein n=1 Tax=Panaeolus cyanescens TaxID=181874 RepID=A0A409YNY4_9AGAR|nr:hypothetical protein CVT24_007086 [Panaeolus cyanescens]